MIKKSQKRSDNLGENICNMYQRPNVNISNTLKKIKLLKLSKKGLKTLKIEKQYIRTIQKYVFYSWPLNI